MLAVLRHPISSGLCRSLLRAFLVLAFSFVVWLSLDCFGLYEFPRFVVGIAAIAAFLFLVLDPLLPSRLELGDRIFDFVVLAVLGALEFVLTAVTFAGIVAVVLLGSVCVGLSTLRDWVRD